MNVERRAKRSTIDDRRRSQPRNACRERVGRNDQTEFCRSNQQRSHQLRPQRHHDHEVNDRRKLDRSQNHQNESFVLPRWI